MNGAESFRLYIALNAKRARKRRASDKSGKARSAPILRSARRDRAIFRLTFEREAHGDN